MVEPPSCTESSRKRCMALGRWIRIGRPTIAYPFADPLLSQPLDLNRTAPLRRPPPDFLLARVRRAPWQGVGRASWRHVGQAPTGCTAKHLMLVVHRPRKSSLTCSRRPRCSLGGPEHPRHPCRCSPSSVLLKLLGFLPWLPLATPELPLALPPLVRDPIALNLCCRHCRTTEPR